MDGDGLACGRVWALKLRGRSDPGDGGISGGSLPEEPSLWYETSRPGAAAAAAEKS